MGIFGRRAPQAPAEPDPVQEARNKAAYVLCWMPAWLPEDGCAGWELCARENYDSYTPDITWNWCYLDRDADPDLLANWVARQTGRQVILAPDMREIAAADDVLAAPEAVPIYWVVPT